PPKPYIRESLRLKAMYMMREQDARNRDGETKERARERFAHVMYPDGLFAWQFHYDFHNTGRAYLMDEGEEGPWIDYEKPNRHTRFVSDRALFPLRSLVPESMDGLLGAQGNVGFSSIVSAAIRLHDQRVHIGQAAGATAAVSLRERVDPRAIVHDRGLLEAVRDGLCSEKMEGVPLAIWPYRDLKPGDPDFVAANRLAAAGVLKVEAEAVDFAGRAAPGFPPDWDMPRFPVSENGDADGDTIPDRDDALLFTPNEPIVWSVEKVEATAENDGLIDPGLLKNPAARRFDFAGKGIPVTEGFERDAGAPYSGERGHGWARDLSANQRRRQAVAEPYRDAFLFTRGEDTWECAVADGRYRVTVCVGDAGHEQPGQNVRVEGARPVDDEYTAAGIFREAAVEVAVADGRLTVTMGRPGARTNTCLVWLAFERLP
ncbi:MAG: FAD-dependent oxidoreductase, partial [Verrucomicrobiae bacterium]|nr:FAD-dependent oxidoreductase [Verrucomicrobiae bacterium]